VLNFARADEAAGNEFQLTAGPARLTGRAAGTGTWYDQREPTFGELRLESGVQPVVIRSRGAIRGALFDLRAIHFRPIAGE